MEPHDEADAPMPAPIDVRDGLENRRQRAMIEAALFDEPAVPTKIGRFTVVRKLGEGGMGVVYVAYDEELDRRVAVKLLRGAGDDDEARQRLQREARAMARLSHPHVVAVHDVGTFEGEVFVAMEFVAGSDLRAWLRGERRPWREVLARFIEAGEGLAAAHEAGLVHRDFKPDNVLLGEDGRVRVADFGLAHHGALAAAVETWELASTEVLRTRTGAVLGTPAYMAPEQFQGRSTDARSDQFGFCVALYEGLHGKRPFEGRTPLALARAVEEGRIDSAPEGSDVPPWLRAAVLRGLSVDPEERWPSMRALLDVLADDPQLRRRRRIRAAAALLVATVAIAGTSTLAVRSARQEARQRFGAELNERLLEIEQERSNRQTQDAKVRAQDSARMGMVDRYQPDSAPAVHRDPTAAAALLRDVEGDARASPRWIAQANVVLGQPLSMDVLTEHQAVVRSLVFAPEEPVLYSASDDGTVRRRVVDSPGGSEVVIRHEQPVTALALDPTGRMLASGSASGELVLWATDGSGEPRRWTEHTAAIQALAFDPTGRWLASASDDGTARLWPLGEGEPRVLRGHDGGVLVAVFDPTGARLLTGSRDQTARVWSVEELGIVAVLRGHTRGVFHARFMDGQRVITAADDRTARIWTLDGSAAPDSEVMVRHEGAITALDGQGDRFLTTAADGPPRVWGVPGGDEVTLAGHDGTVWAGGLTPDGRRVVTIGWDGDVRVHAVDGQGGSEVLRGHRARLVSMAIHPAGRWLATGSFDGMVRLWDLQRPRMRWTMRGHEDQVWSAAIDLQRRRLATISHDGTARVWSLEDGSALAVLRDPQADERPMTAVAFSPDGRTLATGSSRGGLRLWALETGESRELVGHSRDVWQLAFDATGARLASASHDGTARIWDVASGDAVHVLPAGGEATPPARVSRVRWIGAGDALVTADFGGTVRRWDTRTGAELDRRAAHTGPIMEMVVGPDGRALATASVDGTARLWVDVERDESRVLAGHERALSSVAFDGEGHRVITASEDGTARVWTLDGEVVATLVGHSAELWAARFSADGRWVLTASDDGTIRAWVPGVLEGALAQWSHDGPVVGLWTIPTVDRMLSASSDGTARMWSLSGLEVDPDRLGQRLTEVTRYCTPARHRQQLLGEDEAEAAAAEARCRDGRAAVDL